VLLLVGELVTALFAVEGNMSIDEGSWSNYVENIHRVELAVIDGSDPQTDRVTVIPQSILSRENVPIVHDDLPFDVVVEEWMSNSTLYGPAVAPAGLVPRATAGTAQKLAAAPAPPVTGVDGQSVNAPTAYIRLFDRGHDLGRYLVSLYLDQPQEVTIDGRTYTIALRFARSYKPYTLHLVDFRHDKFVGTEKPRNFSSLVRLVDAEQHEDREVLIYMNHPLRYAGETFYQSAFKPGDTGTILQVVHNPGWLLPYISCVVVSIGMMVHFGMHLVQFAGRTKR
jgi:hypothetical protein